MESFFALLERLPHVHMYLLMQEVDEVLHVLALKGGRFGTYLFTGTSTVVQT